MKDDFWWNVIGWAVGLGLVMSLIWLADTVF